MKVMKVAIVLLLMAALVMHAGASEVTATENATAIPTETATENATAIPTETATENATAIPTETATENATAIPTETPRASIGSWSPQVVDYLYVNDTVSETITYTITHVSPMTSNSWTVDGVAVNGTTTGATSSYTHTWTNSSIGSHTVVYTGSNGSAGVEFRWYVNVYEVGTYSGGNLFDVIDDALEYHVTDVKIRMFKYKVAKHGGNAALVAQKVNSLHDSIAKRQMTREALRLELKSGNITSKEYAAAIKQVQRDARLDSELSRQLAKVARDELKDNKAGDELEKLSKAEPSDGRGKGKSGSHGVKEDVQKQNKGKKGKGSRQ